MIDPPCVMCGYCCTVRACGYGKFMADGKCKFLKENDPELGTFKCSLYDKIKEEEKDSKVPMFDNYCSSSVLNTVREEVIRRMAIRIFGEKN